jgi:hypothetical protein
MPFLSFFSSEMEQILLLVVDFRNIEWIEFFPFSKSMIPLAQKKAELSRV